MITDTIQIELSTDVMFEFEVQFYKGTEAKVSGLPEDCYPAEPPELISQKLIGVYIMDGWETLPNDYAKYLWNEYSDRIEQETMEILCEY